MTRISHFFFLCFVVLSVAGCSASTGNSPWERISTNQQAAEQAPRPLNATSNIQTENGAIAQNPAAQAQARQRLTSYANPALTPQAGDRNFSGQERWNQNQSAPHNAQHSQRNLQRQASAGMRGQNQAVASNAPTVKVGLLLPLSGPHEDLGQDMLKAAQLALFDIGDVQFELLPRDTEGTAQQAAIAAQSVLNDGAQIILGPVFSRAVAAVKPIARRQNVNMIAYTTDWQHGDASTYIMGFLPFTQVRRVADYAIANGSRSIGVIIPDNEYGNAVEKVFSALNREYEPGSLQIKTLKFRPGARNLQTLIEDFTDYKARTASIEARELAIQTGANPMDLPAPPVPFDAVMIATGGEDARTIASALSFYGLDPRAVRRLGTGLWDERALSSEPALQGGWFATSEPALRDGFDMRFQTLYGTKPHRLSTLAYDSTALMAILSRNGIQSTGRPAFDRNSLINPNGFAGVDGVFRFRPDGMVERGLAVLEITNGNNRVIDPARKTFQSQSY
jgi:ABC-type branched-subunit amino acid transport system substrate-binding protein